MTFTLGVADLRPRLYHALLLATGFGGLLSGCAPKQVETAPPPPNPFGYLQPSSRCVATPAVLSADKPASTAMSISNDGYCALRYARPDGLPYASFLVTETPKHGDPLIYNYNGQTVVTYTPTAGYAGPDSMTVEFVPGAGEPRRTLHIAIDVLPRGATAHAH